MEENWHSKYDEKHSRRNVLKTNIRLENQKFMAIEPEIQLKSFDFPLASIIVFVHSKYFVTQLGKISK